MLSTSTTHRQHSSCSTGLAEKHPELVRETLNRGHTIALHTRTHPRLSDVSWRQLIDETRVAKRDLEAVIGSPVKWFRPPYGAEGMRSIPIVKASGMTTVVRSADTHDWKGLTEAGALKNVSKNLTPGGIALLHDIPAGESVADDAGKGFFAQRAAHQDPPRRAQEAWLAPRQPRSLAQFGDTFAPREIGLTCGGMRREVPMTPSENPRSGERTIRHIGLLPSADGGLLHLSADGGLPTADVPANQVTPLRSVRQACEALSRSIGAEVTVLRPMRPRRGDETSRTYLLEARHGVPDRWGRFDEVEVSSWDGTRDELRSLLLGLNDALPKTPWYRSGTFAEAERWVGDVAIREGIELLSPLSQLRHWTGSAVYGVDSTIGFLYFKASPIQEAEGSRTHTLGTLFPRLVVPPLSHDSSRGWMLSREAEGEPLSRCGTPPMWERLVEDYARLQVETLGMEPLLVENGFAPLDLQHLHTDAQEMLTDTRILQEPIGGLSNDEARRLDIHSSGWLTSLQELARLDPPRVIEHGDLDSHQVFVGKDSITILDWADSLLTVPFIGVENFIRTLHEGPGIAGLGNRGRVSRGFGSLRRRMSTTSPTRSWVRPPRVVTRDVERRLRSAYTGVWEQSPMTDRDLSRIEELVGNSFPLIRATQHWRWIRELDFPWEAEESLADYLRRDLEIADV